MTAHKHLKQLIRERMSRTGERYSSARRQILRDHPAPPVEPAAQFHFAGCVPATTALRTLLAESGIRHPSTGKPLSEAVVFGLAGGIGMGVFAFRYEKDDFSSFFIGGRHLWHDDHAYLTRALEAFGLQPRVLEAGGGAQAAAHLQAVMNEGRSSIAFVDAASLPHRAMPGAWSGGGYHVVTVYSVDAAGKEALIGDGTDAPITIPTADLSAARARIKKFKNRLICVPEQPHPKVDLDRLVRTGLRRCASELAEPSLKGARRNAQLVALKVLAERMSGTGAESWEQAFRPGIHFWRGLTSLYDFVEHYGTGGGLCRPLFADFLCEAGFGSLAEQYATLGEQWTDLAHAALPTGVPLLNQGRELLDRKAEALAAGVGAEELRKHWEELAALEERARDAFPLSSDECGELRRQLAAQVSELHQAETTALREVERLGR